MCAIIDGRMGECATSVVIEDVDEVAEASARCDVSGGDYYIGFLRSAC